MPNREKQNGAFLRSLVAITPENANDKHIGNELMLFIGFVCQKMAMPVWVNVSSKHKHLPRRESILGVCVVFVYLRACL